MLITESELRYKNDFNLLESISYIDAPSNQVLLHSIPVIESQGNYLVDLNDIIEISQLTEESDMGMVLHSICECNNINPNSVELFIDGYRLLESDDISNIVSGLIHNGVEVYQKPLNENNAAYLLAETAVDEYVYTGDSTLLEEFITDEFLNESNYQRRLEIKAKKSAYARALAANGETQKPTSNSGINRALGKLMDKKRGEVDKEETRDKVSKFYESDKERLDTKGKEFEKRYEVQSEKNDAVMHAKSAIAFAFPNGSKEAKEATQRLSKLESEFKQISKNEHTARRKKIEEIESFKNEINKQSQEKFKRDEGIRKREANTPSTPKGGFDTGGKLDLRKERADSTKPIIPYNREEALRRQASSISNAVNNNDTTSQNPEHSNPIPSNPPKTEEAKKEAVKQTEDKMKNILDTSENKPKNVLARMVASLQNLYRKWLDKKNQAKQNGEDVGFFSNICRIILNCIDKLMWKIRNWSDGTKSKHYNSK